MSIASVGATRTPASASLATRVFHPKFLLCFSLFLLLFAGTVPAWAAKDRVQVAISPSNPTVVSGKTQQFTATVSGTVNTRVSWSASAGTITSSGLFTAPTVTSTTAVTVTATSAADPTKSASATVAVVTQSGLSITTISIPDATVGLAYAFTISATGGTPPYSWSVASGSLPSGIQLSSSSGTLAGTASTAGQYSFSAKVTDAAAHSDTQSFVITVDPAQSGNFDGPAELPRVYINSTIANTPSPGQTWFVAAGGSLQQALNNAACGDIITLQAGATFSGTVQVPAKNCDNAHWITVRTSAPDTALPPEGTRLTPCYAGVVSLPARPAYSCSNPQNVLAKIVIPKGGTGPIIFAPGANHYRFLGLEITRNSNTPMVYALISMTPGFPTDHLVFDRMWIHGTAQDETTKGIRLGGSTTVAVVDSYFSDFHCIAISGACTDSQAIGGGAGSNPMGPYQIVHNFLEAAGEDILFGGAAATSTPADIEVRFNYMFKPLTWLQGQPGYVGGANGNPFIVKTLFELKNAQRVLLEGNVLENTWGGFTQTGFGILLTPKNQSNGTSNLCPLCQVTDVTVRYNTISHVASGMQVGNGLSATGGAALDGERYSIHDIVIDDINPVKFKGFGLLAQVGTGQPPAPLLRSVKIDHITAFAPNVLMAVGDKASMKMPNFAFTNSIVLAGLRPFTTTGGGTANCAYHTSPLTLLNNCFSPWVFATNAIIAPPASTPPSSWPSGNYFPAAPSPLFVNYNGGNGGDYHLVQTSSYKNAGSDGKDIGADIDLISQYTATSR